MFSSYVFSEEVCLVDLLRKSVFRLLWASDLFRYSTWMGQIFSTWIFVFFGKDCGQCDDMPGVMEYKVSDKRQLSLLIS